jgi:hypothetical protein
MLPEAFMLRLEAILRASKLTGTDTRFVAIEAPACPAIERDSKAETSEVHLGPQRRFVVLQHDTCN